MRLCTTHPVVQRTWTVELRPERGGPVLHCPQCPPGMPSVRVAAPEVLAHLAQHARHDTLPAHLRTCQCHARGCRWHRRHRGCAGPVLLVLARERGGRLWRLADVCAACAGATAHAAVVPETTLVSTSTGSPPAGLVRPKRGRTLHGPSEQLRVREMLSYLAASLPPSSSASARLVALQCALRSTATGHVHLPTGLLRGMRLGVPAVPVQDLRDARWLREAAPRTAGQGFSLQLLDPAVSTQAPGRADRARAGDWSLRVCRASQIRALGPGPRLLALALAAHSRDGSSSGTGEEDLFTYVCGFSRQELSQALGELRDGGLLQSWVLDPNWADVCWVLASQAGITGT